MLRYLLERNKTICPFKHSDVCTCSSFIHNNQKLETSSPPTGELINKLVYSHNRTSLHVEGSRHWHTQGKDDSLKHYVKWKEPATKATYYTIPSTWNCRKDIITVTENSWLVARGQRVEEIVWTGAKAKIWGWEKRSVL